MTAGFRHGGSERPDDGKARAFLLIGKPASGKGTQGRMLGAVPGIWFVETGKLLRELVDSDQNIAQEVKPAMEEGKLVPDDLMMRLFAQALNEDLPAKGFKMQRDYLVVDGVPRTIDQAQALDAILDILLIFHLRCDADERLIERSRSRAFSEQRADDRLAVMRKRLALYDRKTVPVLNSYPHEKRIEIDGFAHPLKIHSRMVEALIPIVTQSGRHR